MPPEVAPRGDAVRHSVFIGSSTEGLPIAEQFRAELRREADPTMWYEIFGPGTFTLEALEAALDKLGHALIVLSPDDITKSRGTVEISARDNAIFELGLFIGRHGHRAAFMAIPDEPRLRLPSDLWGLISVQYKIIKGPRGTKKYDISGAVQQIVKALKKEGVKIGRRAHERSSPVWDVMADTILIIHGVESEGAGSHPRPRLSLRDLATSLEIKSFLDRRYPMKRVLLMPASTAGWAEQYTNADLVIVGGFITNAEFAQHRLRYEKLFRLRMGRLCVVDGQRVNIPRFGLPNGKPAPPMGDAQAIEDVPTELTTRDYGFIFSGPLYMYGHERRVVAIAGVKGHGTRGAAAYLCRDKAGVEELLKTPLGRTDVLEAAVAVNVARDLVDTVSPISARRNDEILLEMASPDAEACELGHPCEGCEFGVPRLAVTRPLKLVPSKLKAIVFDLDDTLLDTYGSLITPLELQAARLMIDAGAKERDVVSLACALLHCRRATPFDIRGGLRRKCSPAVMAKRKKLVERTDIPIGHIVLSPDVAQLLRRLRNHFELHLLTSGSAEFQNAKIDQLGIRSYFTDIVIVSNGSHLVKGRALETLATKHRLTHESMLVVGNRLDQEIAAGNSLGMPTVWIRCGEGCEMLPAKGRGEPDFTVDGVMRLPALLWD